MGAGPAGVIAAESIRQYDASSTVTMVGEEFEKPYSRTAIPRFLSGQIDEDGIHLRRMPGHFAARSIDVRKGRVTGLDREAAQVELESGERLEYDRLLIATGSHPVIPDIPGMDLPGVVNCWTLSDARGRLTHRILETGAAETRSLASSVNRMAGDLELAQA
ncbi:MAG: FAD-dependent oxidoreductase, partial [Gammaproteobacteria bacterium]|nr:FAD-dependent oxidoreductase [Gammaproteobacteria bacterium]